MGLELRTFAFNGLEYWFAPLSGELRTFGVCEMFRVFLEVGSKNEGS